MLFLILVLNILFWAIEAKNFFELSKASYLYDLWDDFDYLDFKLGWFSESVVSLLLDGSISSKIKMSSLISIDFRIYVSLLWFTN